MSTKANISVQNLDDTISMVYCHFDGCISSTGKILYDSYNSYELAQLVVSLGDISILKSKYYPDPKYPHTLSTSQPDVTIVYCRDRIGESKTEPRYFVDYEEYIRTIDSDYNIGWCEYNYLFKNGEWLVKRRKSNSWVRVSDYFINQSASESFDNSI